MDYTYEYNGEELTVSLDRTGDGWRVKYDESEFDVSAEKMGSGLFSMIVGDTPYRIYFAETNGDLHIFIAGYKFVFREPGSEGIGTGGGGAAVVDGVLSVSAPMPGEIVKIPVAEGDEVSAGQVVAIVEAMKMENELTTSVDGVVKAVYSEAGRQVDNGELLVEIEAAEG
ncbi:MAG: biotin/lipoyl-binding protein [bacterium]|nr:biotin/lipoyl-binding protein [bacterium]